MTGSGGSARLRWSIMGIVTALHMLIANLFMPGTHLREPPAGPSRTASALQVVFIKLAPDTPSPAPRATAAPATQPVAHPAAPRHVRSTGTPLAPTGTPPAPTAAPVAPSIAVGALPPTKPATPGYVPGGGAFAPGAIRARPRVRLPGALLPGAPRFRMVDPEAQGVAGFVRFLGSFTGAVDRHCLDLDAWRGMTPEERIAAHVSPADLEAIESRYRCAASRRTGRR